MKVSSNKRILRPSTASLNEELSGLTEKIVTYDGQIDYEKNIINKPTFNGKEMVGDIQEEDPTVQPIELAELNDIFNSIFAEKGVEL